MESNETIVISQQDLFEQDVDEVLLHRKAIERQNDPDSLPSIPLIRRIIYSNLFYIPFFTTIGALIGWVIYEPFFDDNSIDSFASYFIFAFISTMIVAFHFIGENFMRRTIGLGLRKGVIRGAITFGVSLLALVPAGLLFFAFALTLVGYDPAFFNDTQNIRQFPPNVLLRLIAFRSAIWAVFGAAIGAGMYMGDGTDIQSRNAMLGGSVGGALGGLFFDPIDLFIFGGVDDAYLIRMIGFMVIGLCIGLFVALGEQLSRDGWFLIKTGPLAGKSFILYRELTTIGSSPHADIYLFKDRDVVPKHAVIHRVGNHYEIENCESNYYTMVNGAITNRRHLISGDQLTLGATILEYEERAKRVSPHKLIAEEEANHD